MGHVAKIWVVTKSDVDVGAPYLHGAFLTEKEARDSCVGPGTFLVAACDPGRAYPIGTLLDVEVVTNVTIPSLRARP